MSKNQVGFKGNNDSTAKKAIIPVALGAGAGYALAPPVIKAPEKLTMEMLANWLKKYPKNKTLQKELKPVVEKFKLNDLKEHSNVQKGFFNTLKEKNLIPKARVKYAAIGAVAAAAVVGLYSLVTGKKDTA